MYFILPKYVSFKKTARGPGCHEPSFFLGDGQGVRPFLKKAGPVKRSGGCHLIRRIPGTGVYAVLESKTEYPLICV